MAKVSVIVPVYKSEQYLPRCVESIQNQTVQNLEILLIDDGSPDNCPAMCDDFAAADPRIRVIHQENKGVAAARNTGLDLARGDYITFVDSDDWIEPDMYERMLKTAQDYSCDVVLCDCVKDFEEHSEIYSHNIRDGFYSEEQMHSEYYPHLLMMEDVEYPATISNCLLFVQKECMEGIRYVEGVRFSEDLLFGAQVMVNAKSFYYLKGECFYHYCMNPTSATHIFKVDKWNDYCILHQATEQFFSRLSGYDFRPQIDRMLLIFIYDTIADIRRAEGFSMKDKKDLIRTVLKTPCTRMAFSRIDISKLLIPWKLKVYTFLYKHCIGIYLVLMRDRLCKR